MKEIEFPLNRYKHCHSVGKKMYAYAKERLGWDEERCQKMFVLGVLHDIGYELDGSVYGHGTILANILKGYEFADEIDKHCVLHESISEELALLYYADATVDGQGNWCRYEERDADLISRYGTDSPNRQDGVRLSELLKERGFDDTFGLI